MKLLSRVRLFATPWTVAHQAPPSMEFSREEYWSGLPFPSPGDPPYPGIKPGSPALREDALPSELPGNQIIILSFHSSFQICACGLLQGQTLRPVLVVNKILLEHDHAHQFSSVAQSCPTLSTPWTATRPCPSFVDYLWLLLHYSWPLNNMGLNCVVHVSVDFFSVQVL